MISPTACGTMRTAREIAVMMKMTNNARMIHRMSWPTSMVFSPSRCWEGLLLEAGDQRDGAVDPGDHDVLVDGEDLVGVGAPGGPHLAHDLDASAGVRDLQDHSGGGADERFRVGPGLGRRT